MPYEATFFRTLPEDGSLEGRFDSGEYRATAVLRTGQYAAVAFSPLDASAPRLMSPCPPGDPNCDLAVLSPIVAYVSHYKPAPVIALVLLKVRLGRLRSWGSAVRETDSRGVRLAVSHLQGIEGANVLIELVGEELDDVQSVLLDLVDRDDVADFSVLHVRPEDARGFGGGEAASVS